ncbi:MAG TPA: 2-oxoglutarate dehydrogenase E1 component [Polyangiaceae bacterium]|nr:2-oxoglutarate dehydrogenase E1 component [Polyangiaceae bacterium]
MSFSGYSQGLVEELYAQYLENPKNVDASWRAFFDEGNGASSSASSARGPSVPPVAPIGGTSLPPGAALASSRRAQSYDGPERRSTGMSGRVHALITAYRFLGHQAANINPLRDEPPRPKELELETYGLTEGDLTRSFATVDLPGPDEQSLAEIVDRMEETYCRSIGVEFRSIQNTEERHWLQNQMEATKNRLPLDRDEQIHLLRKLIDAENLERFIASSYAPGTKRFSLEGGESLIPLLDMIIEVGAEHGIGEMVFGMAHRGRLNVLVNTLETSLREIFYAFEDVDAERYLGRGDVKYHLGFSSDRLTAAGKKVHLTMTFNPSHLEFVNPVVEGRTRAKQDRTKDADRTRIAPILIHGDAAFVGQGVNIETLNLTGLEGYTTGGTIHIIVNNQIGFTTDPHDSRSTPYASDILRMLDVPVFHVNGEDPEAVAQVAKLAVSYRQRFHKDVCIDLYCYRRHGHNEGDEPRFTQPKMYEVIDRKPTVRQMYVKRLVSMGQVTEEVADEISVKARSRLEEALEEVKRHGFCPVPDTMGGVWTDYRGGWEKCAPDVETKVDRDTLVRLSETITTLPDGFTAHKKIKALLAQRHKRIAGDQPFDWGTAELLAYASLLNDGAPIRLSGEDVRRGTFSHRHCFVVDQKTGKAYAPLSKVNDRVRFEAFNSPLSEAGVLGFEFGYSLDSPHMLTIWEAQFGDFLNAAQVIVDQFITSCEDKWMRLSGLTLYLPHGYEGQGPEHSSARVERFLQNAAEDNVQICNLTTPAQLFHVLRRQVVRTWRKPLVIFTPKSLLRAAFSADGPRPTSTLKDLTDGRFQRVIPDDVVSPEKTRKVLLCTGKVYYDLARHRFEKSIDDVAILRLEQLYPLNHELPDALRPYADGTPLLWVQEEPWNFGAWFYVNAELRHQLGEVMPKSVSNLGVVARERSASPATGSKSSHNLEQERLVERAFA